MKLRFLTDMSLLLCEQADKVNYIVDSSYQITAL